MSRSRPVTSLHQIELTSRCNLRCVYCAHPTMARPKLDLSPQHWTAALAWVAAFVAAGTQGELNLAGIGESTLRDDLPARVAEARAVLGPRRLLTLATNGIAVTPALVAALKPSEPRLWVSLHRPEKATHAIALLRDAGLLIGTSTHPATEPNNWAGQVDWPTPPTPTALCPWLTAGWAVVFADGRVGTCCLDGQGADGIIGSVTDDPRAGWRVAPYSLCRTCWQAVPTALRE